MTDFFLFAWLNLPNVQVSIAKNFFDSEFSFPMFGCAKSVKFHFRWGTKPRDQKQETGNDCDIISGLQAPRKTDFSDIFLLWANQFAKKWYNSALLRKKIRKKIRKCWRCARPCDVFRPIVREQKHLMDYNDCYQLISIIICLSIDYVWYIWFMQSDVGVSFWNSTQ